MMLLIFFIAHALFLIVLRVLCSYFLFMLSLSPSCILSKKYCFSKIFLACCSIDIIFLNLNFLLAIVLVYSTFYFFFFHRFFPFYILWYPVLFFLIFVILFLVRILFYHHHLHLHLQRHYNHHHHHHHLASSTPF